MDTTTAAAIARNLSTDTLRRAVFTQDGLSRTDAATVAVYKAELLARR